MSDLVTFLRARLDEDEDRAKRAAFGWGAEWRADRDDQDDEWWAVHADGKTNMVSSEDGDVAQHIALHDPARVLADVAAKREILADLADVEGQARTDRASEYWRHRRHAMRLAAAYLATAYAAHHDYDEAWRP